MFLVLSDQKDPAGEMRINEGLGIDVAENPLVSGSSKTLPDHRTVCFFWILAFMIMGLARPVQGTNIDIMLVYDNTAASWVEDNGGMSAFSHDAVNNMNQAIDNSEIDLSFQLVHFMAVDYDTEDLEVDLERLQKSSMPFEVYQARDEYGADVVAMLVDTGSAYGHVGIAYTLSSWSGNPGYAYSVSAVMSVNISHILTHEIGHNLGAHHSKDQTSSPGPNQYLDNQYSAGWYFTGTDNENYHTIMAYSNDGSGNSYHPAPLFSTPLVAWKGTNAGHITDGDNARLIRETKDIVAGYRESVEEVSGSITVIIQPDNPDFMWRRKGTEFWYLSGETEPDVPDGTYTIEFKDVKGWRSPEDRTVVIDQGEDEHLEISYSRVNLPGVMMLLLEEE